MNHGNEKSKGEGISHEGIMELSWAFQGSRILLSAFELDVFTVLGDEEKSSEEVADAIGADPRGTDRLLNALCALEVLSKSRGKFTNSPAAAQLLVKGKPGYQAGFMHAVHLWDSWSTMTNAVQNGGLINRSPVEDRDDTWFVAFIAAMHGRATKEAPGLVSRLDLASVSRVLDVGGGSGAFSMAFVRAKDGLKSTLFDLPNVVSLARGYIEKQRLSDRIDTVTGDYNQDELPIGYDLVFLSAIIHSNSPQQNQSLFNKVSRSLNPGGRIIVSDFIMNDDRISPAFGAFFALNMLVNTPEGDTYTEQEVKEWITTAGMSFVERNDGLMIGQKG
jgi:2-polyprenyl-3-methyl-5-hydroxy-6-metoxy-1,4-benzoquinol methylase